VDVVQLSIAIGKGNLLPDPSNKHFWNERQAKLVHRRWVSRYRCSQGDIRLKQNDRPKSSGYRGRQAADDHALDQTTGWRWVNWLLRRLRHGPTADREEPHSANQGEDYGKDPITGEIERWVFSRSAHQSDVAL